MSDFPVPDGYILVPKGVFFPRPTLWGRHERLPDGTVVAAEPTPSVPWQCDLTSTHPPLEVNGPHYHRSYAEALACLRARGLA